MKTRQIILMLLLIAALQGQDESPLTISVGNGKFSLSSKASLVMVDKKNNVFYDFVRSGHKLDIAQVDSIYVKSSDQSKIVNRADSYVSPKILFYYSSDFSDAKFEKSTHSGIVKHFTDGFQIPIRDEVKIVNEINAIAKRFGMRDISLVGAHKIGLDVKESGIIGHTMGIADIGEAELFSSMSSICVKIINDKVVFFVVVQEITKENTALRSIEYARTIYEMLSASNSSDK